MDKSLCATLNHQEEVKDSTFDPAKYGTGGGALTRLGNAECGARHISGNRRKEGGAG